MRKGNGTAAAFFLMLCIFAVTLLCAPPAVADPAALRGRLSLLAPEELQLHAATAGTSDAPVPKSEESFFSPSPAAQIPAKDPRPPLHWESGIGKSYSVPALTVPGFLLALNLFDRVAYADKTEDGVKVYSSNLSTTWEHLHRQNWVFDKDPFNVNQFGHPYQGGVMYGLARSSGLNFWESLFYTNVGSFLWEMAGETDPPSINDAVNTGNAGSLLGEALFRMASLVLEDGGPHPDTLHELSAALISPPTAFNRAFLGDRFRAVFPGHKPATFWRVRLGVSLDTNKHTVSSTQILRHDATADFSMIYGLPGKPGYTYRRPLDYFDFQLLARARSNNAIGTVMLHGLLFGDSYEAGENYRGIWGLFGSYDFVAPEVFRISTIAASLGTVGQYWIAPGVALQGSVLGGVGFGAAGKTPVPSGDRDYHYGVTPQGVGSFRLIFGDRTLIYLTATEYYVSGAGSDNSDGAETIFRGNGGFTVRLFGRHGLGIQYLYSSREAKYGNLRRLHQEEGSVSVVYTLLGDSRFGLVDWR